MAYFFSGQSHTFNEYLLVPGYSSSECIPDNVSLRTPLTRFRAGEEPALSLNVPMVSAVMQSVSGDRLAVALAQEGGVSFLYGSQSIEDEAAMVAASRATRRASSRAIRTSAPMRRWPTFWPCVSRPVTPPSPSPRTARPTAAWSASSRAATTA